MPFYDLNVPHDSNARDLSRTIAFHAELGFTQIAIALSITGKIPATPPPVPLESITVPKSVSLLTRMTLHVHDPSQNHRLAQLQSAYDLIALRPTTEKALGLCCNSLECDLISLDFSVRLGYPLRFKTVASALQRGIRFEICYSPGITGGSDARRNLIGGTAALIRATRGRGIIISSEARSALGLRGPWDVINLAVVWGINQERGKEAICEEARKVLQLARLKRESYRGVVDIVFGGEKVGDVQKNQDETRLTNGTKRKAIDISGGVSHTEEARNDRPLSKGQMKRLKKQQRNTKLEGTEVASSEKDQTQAPATMPILHETLVAHGKT
jgi:ribonuclease P/MRP protein subunit RPP1